MALSVCKKCGYQFSDRYAICPKCGCPNDHIIPEEQTLEKDKRNDKEGKKRLNSLFKLSLLLLIAALVQYQYIWDSSKTMQNAILSCFMLFLDIYMIWRIAFYMFFPDG